MAYGKQHDMSRLYNNSKQQPQFDVRYEDDDESSYRPLSRQSQLSWGQGDMPVPRDVTNSAFLSAGEKPERPDSVFDAYADMYAYSESDGHEDDEAEDERDQPSFRPSEPWDERGKTGLYGGGGRGADDRETGWKRDYNQPEDEDVYPKPMSRDRSSSGTEQSSFGPITPNSAHFPRGQGSNYNDNSQYQTPTRQLQPLSQQPRPLSADSRIQGGHSRQASSSNRPQQAPPLPHTILPARTPPSAEAGRLKKMNSAPPPPPPAPSRPQQVPRPMVVGPPSQAMADMSLAGSAFDAEGMKRSKSTGFKWSGKGKKGITISAPILPEGFVESLGMETFALTPGCSAPVHGGERAAARPPPSDAFMNMAEPGSQAGDRMSIKSQKKAGPPGPRPKQVPQRPQQAPPLKSGGISIPAVGSNGSSPNASPMRRPSLMQGNPDIVRTPLDALRSADDRATYYQQDAFRRLSRDSVVSYAPSSMTLVQDAKTSRKFFDDLREERQRAQNEESHANSRPVVAAPPMPQRSATTDSYSENRYSSHSGSYTSTPIQSKGGEVFNNPFGGSGGSSGAPSIRRKSNFSTHSGPAGAARAYALSHHRPSIASGRTLQKQTSGQGWNASRQLESDDDNGEDEDRYRASQQNDEHRGSASSAYSDASEAPPPSNTFHPGNNYSQGYSTQSITQPLRKNSIATLNGGGGYNTQPLSFGGNRGGQQQQQSSFKPAFSAVEASPAPSAGGDVVWGAQRSPDAYDSPASHGAEDRQEQLIGGTGFRNPFGANGGGGGGGWQPGWN